MAGTYAALLRGINVGGHHKVPMARLRELAIGLGFTDVRTHLQSGNLVFRTTGRARGPDAEAKLESGLEAALAEEFGFEVPVLVRTTEALERALAGCPWPGEEFDPAKVLLLFLRERPAPGHFDRLDASRFEPDEFRLGERVVYCYFPNGMGRSKLAAALENVRPALTMTGRNWRTVRKLIDLAS